MATGTQKPFCIDRVQAEHGNFCLDSVSKELLYDFDPNCCRRSLKTHTHTHTSRDHANNASMPVEGATVHLPPIRIIHRSDLRASDEPGSENRFGKDKRYKPMEGSIELETNYHRDYPKKPIALTKIIRPDRQREAPGEFVGQPTYRDDYKAYDLQAGARTLHQYEYRPPSKKFEGTSNYSQEYVPHQLPVFKTSRPLDRPRASEEPLSSSTSYRESFPKYPPQGMRQQLERPRWQPSLAPMNDITNYKSDYTTKSIELQTSCKPNVGPYHSEGPFESSTTQKTSYVGWKIEKPFSRERAVYKTPDGDFDFSTTNRMEYTPKALEKAPSKRPPEANKSLGTFDGTTNYETEFRSWPLGERTKSMRKNEYSIPEAPFSGEPTYKSDFVQHEVTPRKDYRPNEAPMRSEDPFPTVTQYRDNYVDYKLPERERTEKPIWLPNPVKMDATTNYRSDFIRREFVRAENCKPEARPVHVDGESTEYGTTHLASYTPWKFVNHDEGGRAVIGPVAESGVDENAE